MNISGYYTPTFIEPLNAIRGSANEEWKNKNYFPAELKTVWKDFETIEGMSFDGVKIKGQIYQEKVYG